MGLFEIVIQERGNMEGPNKLNISDDTYIQIISVEKIIVIGLRVKNCGQIINVYNMLCHVMHDN